MKLSRAQSGQWLQERRFFHVAVKLSQGDETVKTTLIDTDILSMFFRDHQISYFKKTEKNS